MLQMCLRKLLSKVCIQIGLPEKDLMDLWFYREHLSRIRAGVALKPQIELHTSNLSFSSIYFTRISCVFWCWVLFSKNVQSLLLVKSLLKGVNHTEAINTFKVVLQNYRNWKRNFYMENILKYGKVTTGC